MLFVYHHFAEHEMVNEDIHETDTNNRDPYSALSTNIEYSLYEDPLETYNFLAEIENENGCTAKCYMHTIDPEMKEIPVKCKSDHTDYIYKENFENNPETMNEIWLQENVNPKFYENIEKECKIEKEHVHIKENTESSSGRAYQHDDIHFYRQYRTEVPNYDHIYIHDFNNFIEYNDEDEMLKESLMNNEYSNIENVNDTETYAYKHDNYSSADTIRSMYFTGTESEVVKTNETHYQKLKYQNHNIVSGIIGNKYKVNIIIDNGATYSIMSTKMYKTMPELRTIPKIPLAQDISINTGNGTIKCHFWIEIPIKIEQIEMQIRMLVCDTLAEPGILLGRNTLQELAAWQDYTANTIFIAQISIPLVAMQAVNIPPGEAKQITMRLRFNSCSYNTLEDFCGRGIIYTKHPHDPFMPYVASEVTIINNKAQIKIRNTLESNINIKENEIVAYLDCRSKGKFLTLEAEHERNEQVYDILFNEHEIVHKTLTPEPIAKERIMHPCEAPRIAQRTQTQIDDTNICTKEDKLPWLEKDDPRRKMTDKEILKNKIKFKDTLLKTEVQQEEFYTIIEGYKQAFSLRDEIGTCPYVEVHLKLRDETPFFVRPYAIREEHKKVIDKEMKRLEYLGIIKKGLTGYSSPVLLVKRKQQNLYRVCTDFRVLNDRLIRINHAFPLVRDCIESIGSAKCEVMSTIDLRDAFHTLRLAPESQQYCGITPFYGSPTYHYLRMGMGMSVSAQIWQQFVDLCFNDKLIKHPERYKIIMDDAMLFSTMTDHYDGLIDMFKVLIKYGLKISPHKCQFFREKLIYMGLQFMIRNKTACYTPMKDKCEAIRSLEHPRNIKQCRAFCGMVNFLSTFLKDLRKHLIPIYDLQKKKRIFKWTQEAQDAFDKIKELLLSPPILHMPTSTGLLRLESDTSRQGVGGTLFQWQRVNEKDQWVIVGFHSKKLPEAVKNYGVTELELTGLIVNIHGFSQLLRHRYFEVLVDHKAIENLRKGKTEPPTNRLTTLLLKLRDYQIDLKYQIGKQMHTSDALSRLFNSKDSKDLDDVIPLNFLQHLSDKHIIHMYKHLAEPIFSHKKAEATVPKRPRGRPRKNTQGTEKPKTTPRQRAVNLPKSTKSTRSDANILKLRQLYDNIIKPDVNTNTQNTPLALTSYDTLNNSTLEEQLAGDKTVDTPAVVNTIRAPDKEYYQVAKPILPENTSLSILRRHIPRQSEIDSVINTLKTKVLHTINLPIDTKDMAIEYKKSIRFKDIYLYIGEGKLPSKIPAQKKIRAESLNYVVVNELLFRLDAKNVVDPGGNQMLLVIPEKYEPNIFNIYHNSLMAGHQGPWKTFITIRKKFFMHNMLNKLKRYIEACHTCLKTKPKSTVKTPQYGRIPTDYSPMHNLSADIKYMPEGFAGFKFLLVVTCEHTNFTMAIPLTDRKAQPIAEALIHRVISIFGPPKLLIVDQDAALTGVIIKLILKALLCDMKLISPYNHGSSKTERQIKSISTIITKQLWDKGQMWPLFAGVSAFAMNTFSSDALNGFSPFELVFARKPPDLSNLTLPAIEEIPVQYREYYRLLKARAEYIKQLHIDWKTTQAENYEAENKMFVNEESFAIGDLVYLLAPHASSLQSGTSKFRQDFIGPLAIDTALDRTHYTLKDLSNRVLPEVYHVNRIKSGPVNTPQGIVRTHDEYLKAVHSNQRQLNEIQFKSLPTIQEAEED